MQCSLKYRCRKTSSSDTDESEMLLQPFLTLNLNKHSSAHKPYQTSVEFRKEIFLRNLQNELSVIEKENWQHSVIYTVKNSLFHIYTHTPIQDVEHYSILHI